MRTCQDCKQEYERPQKRGALTTLCPKCHLARRVMGIRKKTPWTPERDAYLKEHYDPHNRNGKVIAKALGVSLNAVYLRASVKGLSIERKQGRRAWTEADLELLQDRCGDVPVEEIARTLKRSVTAVRSKAADLGIQTAHRPDGFSVPDLVEGFGVSHHTVHAWINSGRLRATRAASGVYVIEAEDVRFFVRTNPYAFSVKRVDQTFFLEVAVGLIASDRALQRAS